ncbi:hypothetical protein BN2475_710113 [Paraburkholderia ribeironis]|uniref:Uncharacterized protein n=1 Tax=Paraburkholderia ribeironis TaxID=1247936 RepID=A0A1N7SII0_9BURK|nr:hypothetical protein BN2475_710113 [Paraburkholderia ribeironis]
MNVKAGGRRAMSAGKALREDKERLLQDRAVACGESSDAGRGYLELTGYANALRIGKE